MQQLETGPAFQDDGGVGCKIWEKLISVSDANYLVWVPGRGGVEGNEMADSGQRGSFNALARGEPFRISG